MTRLLKFFSLGLVGNLLLSSAGSLASPPMTDRAGPKEDPYLTGAVHNTIRKKFKDLQGCFLEYIKKNPRYDGSLKTVHLDWQISPAGKVVKPEVVDSDAGDDAFSGCLAQKIQSYEFPPPPTERNFYVEHFFRFKKEGVEEKAK